MVESVIELYYNLLINKFLIVGEKQNGRNNWKKDKEASKEPWDDTIRACRT